MTRALNSPFRTLVTPAFPKHLLYSSTKLDNSYLPTTVPEAFQVDDILAQRTPHPDHPTTALPGLVSKLATSVAS